MARTTAKMTTGEILLELVKHCPLPVESRTVGGLTGGGDPFIKDAQVRWRWAEAMLAEAPEVVRVSLGG